MGLLRQIGALAPEDAGAIAHELAADDASVHDGLLPQFVGGALWQASGRGLQPSLVTLYRIGREKLGLGSPPL